VSAVADPTPGFDYYDTDSESGWGVIGGTSLSSPIVAGAFALGGRSGQGPAAVYSASTYDITTGNNGACSSPTSRCTAGVGYDGPTGVGTPTGAVTAGGTVAAVESTSVGGVYGSAYAPSLPPTPFWPGRNLARDADFLPGQTSGYVLDAYGGVSPVHGATPEPITGYWPGTDLARALTVRPDGISGYTVDAYGGLHPFGPSGDAPGEPVTGYWPGRDLARDIVLDPCDASHESGYVLDAYGGISPFGGAPPVTITGYWSGQNLAHRLVMNTCPTPGHETGYVLDGYGGLHPFWANNFAIGAPSPTGYWPGTDIARDIALSSNGNGYVVDGYGGIHSFGGPVGLSSAVYLSGNDTVRSISIT
jgi:hypothetical protein